MRKTFVLDLDGTLLQGNGQLHPDVCGYLIKLQEQGYRVVVATGRKHNEAENILKDLKLKEYRNAAILSDGQYLIDYCDDTEIIAPFLKYPDDYTKIMESFDKGGVVKLMTVGQDYDVFRSVFNVTFWKRFVLNTMKRRNPLHGLLICSRKEIKDIEKITVKPNKGSVELNDNINEQYQVAFVNDKERFEFKAKAVNKSEMLKKYLLKYSIEQGDVLVFGNDENDICMFTDFANSFAVDTAKDHVKEKAREVVQHNDGLGIIDRIKDIVKGE